VIHIETVWLNLPCGWALKCCGNINYRNRHRNLYLLPYFYLSEERATISEFLFSLFFIPEKMRNVWGDESKIEVPAVSGRESKNTQIYIPVACYVSVFYENIVQLVTCMSSLPSLEEVKMCLLP